MKRFNRLLVVSLLMAVVMGITCFLQAATALTYMMTEYPVPTSYSGPYGITAGKSFTVKK